MHALLQTRDGYLWAGMKNGLVRFDGMAFTVFDHVNTPGLKSDDCRTLGEDSSGDLWIGTASGLVRKSGTHFVSCAERLGASSMAYPPICPSRMGGVWVAGKSCVYRVESDTARRYPMELSHVTGLQEDGDGVLWITTFTGAVRFDPRRGHTEIVGAGSPQERLPCWGTWEDPEGRRWFPFGKFIPQMGEPLSAVLFASLAPRPWPAPLETRDGWVPTALPHLALAVGDKTVWMASDRGAIFRFRSPRTQTLPMPQPHAADFPLSALVDREGNLWLGMDHTGLQCWIPRRVSGRTTDDGLAHPNTWSLFEGRDGSVWAGTDGGVTRFKDGEGERLKRGDGTEPTDVRAVVEDLDGSIWVGTMRSLERFQAGICHPIRLPGEWYETKVRALCPSRDGSMWVGTVKGLTRLRNGERTKYTTADGLGSDEVRAILEDRSGTLWLGTLGGGLSRLQNGKLTTFTTAEGLPSNDVWALAEDKDGAVWLGTDNGLARVKAAGIEAFGVAQGLPDPLVNCLLADDSGRLWVGHDSGIYFVSISELLETAHGSRATVTPISLDESDGLPGAETNGQKSYPAACKTRDGRLWFPTTHGVAVIDPAHFRSRSVPPLAVIEVVRANGKVVFGNGPLPVLPPAASPQATPMPGPETTRPGAGILLPPGGARVLEFHYTANAFVAPQRAQFRYRLLGFEREWSDAGTRRQAYYTGLRPGRYRFEVTACNRHGVWQEHPAAIALRLAPHYYQTWWFYTLIGLGTMALVALFVSWRARELQRIHQLERAQALDQQRRRIARDIHDELGSSLTHILQLTTSAQEVESSPGKPVGPSERIAAIAGEAVDNLGEIVWVNNPEYDTLEDLAAYLREYAASYFADTNVRLRCDFPETVPARRVSGLFRRHLVLLLKEALQNVSKHADARNVSIRLAVGSSRLELAVADDGLGFSAGNGRSNGSGLSNMRSRVGELRGAFRADSGPDLGTRIQIEVPLE